MPAINWTINLQAVGGPWVTQAGSVQIDAYQRAEVTVPTGATISIQVPGGSANVGLLYIGCDLYGTLVTYQLNGAGNAIPLDGPRLFVGGSAMGMLPNPLDSLKVTNNAVDDVRIEILVGRDVTP